jgi:HK97 gp10 family phage protein
MGADFKWYGNEAKKLIRGTMVQRLEKAAILVKNATKEEISEPSPPTSEPGEAPHKHTGRLRASISHQVDKDALKAYVGTNVKYGKWLELGTKKMAPRPFLSATVDKLRAAITSILKG